MKLRIVTLELIRDISGQDCLVRMGLQSETGKGWCLDLSGFRPHMHCDQPEQGTAEDFVDWLVEQGDAKDVQFEETEKQSLYGYQGNNQKRMLRLTFPSDADRRRCKKLWFPYAEQERIRIPTVCYKSQLLRCYESAVPAVIQFIHMANINPAGIVDLDTTRLGHRVPARQALREHHYRTSWRAIQPSSQEAGTIPLSVLSFDIEASSEHGDFPMAVKDYSLTAREMLKKGSECKRAEWDVRGWLAQALGLAPVTYPDISRLVLKGEPAPERVAETLERVLEKECDAGSSQSETMLSKYLREWALAKSDSGDDADGSESDASGDEEDPASAPRRSARIRSAGPSTGRTGPEAIMAGSADGKEKQELLTALLTTVLPRQEGDKVTYIGAVLGTTRPSDPCEEICFCLPTVSPKHARQEVVQCSSEVNLLLTWSKWVARKHPNLIIGYNIFGFDYPFLNDRAIELGKQTDFLRMTPNHDTVCGEKARHGGAWKIHETKIVLASGEHQLRQIRMPCCVNIDLYNYFRKTVSLPAYGLADVSAEYLGGTVTSVKPSEGGCTITVDDAQGVVRGSAIALMEAGRDRIKRQVVAVDGNTIQLAGEPRDWTQWAHAKDDVTPQDIFRLSSSGVPEEATRVADYCVQDCSLVSGLFAKVDIMTDMTEMSNTSAIPLEFLVLRGQGIKLMSVLTRECNLRGRVVEDICRKHPDEGYDGAEVLTPFRGIYKDPVNVLDYASLYPSADISDNISHDSKLWFEQRDTQGVLVKREGDPHAELVPGHHVIVHEFPTSKWIRAPKRGGGFRRKRIPTGRRRVGFVQYALGDLATMPAVLKSVLAKRKSTRAQAKDVTVIDADGREVSGGGKQRADDTWEIRLDDGTVVVVPNAASSGLRFNAFVRNILDKRQLSYKKVANSMYGGTGAPTSMFYEPDIAATITAIGRAMLGFAKACMEGVYNGRLVVVLGQPVIATAKCVYGDTDSVFVAWVLIAAAEHPTLEPGTEIKGKDALPLTIAISEQAEAIASACLRKPHTLEYEKTFMPWLLLTRKRYAGDKYVTAKKKPKRISMGLVLRRRDNAPIVKEVYTKVMDDVLTADPKAAFARCLDYFRTVVRGDVHVDDLIVSKALRGHYADPGRIPHKMLADRIAARDPGNAPRPGDRIPYVFIKVADKTLSQKDRIETPERAGGNIDYRYYLEHQLLKPVAQLFELVLEDLPGARRRCKPSVLRPTAPLAARNKATERLMLGALTDPKQRTLGDFFG